jgi:hypothetical protein
LTGFADGAETALLAPTIAGSASLVKEEAVDMFGFDISGLNMAGLLPENFGEGVDPAIIFSEGAQLILAEIELTQDVYAFECNQYGLPLALMCQNAFVQSYEQDPVTGEETVTLATTLDDTLSTNEEVSLGEPSAAGVWIGDGYDEFGYFEVQAYLSSSDGTTAGEDLSVVFVRNYFSGGEFEGPEPEVMEFAPLVLNAEFAPFPMLEFSIPQFIVDLADIDVDNENIFLFTEQELDGEPVVRVGYKELAGEGEGGEFAFNDVAMEDFLNAFSADGLLGVGEEDGAGEPALP